jgi:hypothetical protein
MNLSQALAAAAAAFVTGVSMNGAAPTFARCAATTAQEAFDRAGIRDAAEELVALMEHSYHTNGEQLTFHMSLN